MSRQEFLLRLGRQPTDPLQPATATQPQAGPAPAGTLAADPHLWSQQQQLLPTSASLLQNRQIPPAGKPTATAPGMQGVIPPTAQLAAPKMSREGVTAQTPLPADAMSPQAGMRAQTILDKLREQRDQLGQVIAPLIGLDWNQMAEDQRRGLLQGIAPDIPGLQEITTKFPQFAEEYPPLAKFPAWMEKEKSPGEFYLSRQQSPEAQAFQRERQRVMADMEEQGYSPFFDVGKRYHVDPKHYPAPSENLAEGYRPVKEETANAWRAKVQTPEARQRLQEAYDAGVKFGGHDRWYQMGQLEKAFTKELGAKEGRKRFFEWTQAMAATTAGASPEMNLISAQYARYLRNRGEEIPLDVGKDAFGNVVGTGKPASYAMPAPTAGLYLGGNMEQFQKVINEGKGLGWTQPKRTSFNWNFLGRKDMSTIDEQMASLITPELEIGGKMKKIAAPPQGSYFAYDELISEMAAKNGVSPDEFQAIVWGGKKQAKKGSSYVGKSMMEIVNEAIERTSRLTGKSPQEVLRRGIIRAEIPIYGLVGAAGAGAVAAGAAGGKQGEQ